jgi:AraC-like DNA-binding protein
MDALSELLRSVKLSGALFFNAHCYAPWCVQAAPSQSFRPFIAQPATHVIEFHVVVEGRGYIRVGNETTPLAAGDIAIVPHGDPHRMGNGLPSATSDGTESLESILRGDLRPYRIGSGEGELTRLVCGYLGCEKQLVAPLLVGLPRVVRVHLRDDAYGESLERMVGHAVEQVAGAVPGSDVVVARLAEVLFAEALRRYVRQLPPQRTGWLAGAADPAVGRALAAMHQRPAHPWTLEELAHTAGTSRSTLAERFARYLGHGPMAYLADWRLELAAESLRTTSRSVVDIAGDVGYESEAAFNRAFKRRFALPPARYRKTLRASSARQPIQESADA